jgi:hypothetical protein
MRPSAPGRPPRIRPARLLAAPLALGILVAAAGASDAAAQLRAAEVIDTPHGRVEFLGLEDWTASMVLDSLGARAPGAPPAQWATALQAMGFPRASVNALSVQGAGAVTLVTVVEPHRGDRIRAREGFGPPGALPEGWSELARLAAQENPAFQSAVSLRWFREMDGGMPAFFLENLEASGQRAVVEELWDLLDARLATSDLVAAVRILAEDGDPAHRAVAAAVVSGFPEEDEAWRALVEALRDPRATVNSTASQALASMLTLRPRRVDWAATGEGIRALLAGTNLSAFPVLVQTLLSTEVAPSLAPTILPGSERLLLAHLSSTYSPSREASHRLLVHLRGADLGPDPQPWADWIEGLR